MKSDPVRLKVVPGSQLYKIKQKKCNHTPHLIGQGLTRICEKKINKKCYTNFLMHEFRCNLTLNSSLFHSFLHTLEVMRHIISPLPYIPKKKFKSYVVCIMLPSLK